MRGKGVQLIAVLTRSRQFVKLVSTTPVYEELSNPSCLTLVLNEALPTQSES